ncbi:MAG: polysaccharide deacetylase family protein [bacterium]
MGTLTVSSDDRFDQPSTSEPTLPKILVFHKVTPQFSYGSTNYSPRRLCRLLSVLQERGYRFESLENTLTGADPFSIAITFDDGYQHLADILPKLIDRFHLQPVVFVPTRYIGRPNNWDYSCLFRTESHLDVGIIKVLARQGVEFGSHGHSHINLCRCDAKVRRGEIQRSKEMLQDLLGAEIRYISYPFGRYNEEVMQDTQEIGYTRGLTMSFPDRGDMALSTGRFCVYGYDTTASVRRKLTGGPLYRFEKWKADFSNRLSAGTELYRRLFGKRRG